MSTRKSLIIEVKTEIVYLVVLISLGMLSVNAMNPELGATSRQFKDDQEFDLTEDEEDLAAELIFSNRTTIAFLESKYPRFSLLSPQERSYLLHSNQELASQYYFSHCRHAIFFYLQKLRKEQYRQEKREEELEKERERERERMEKKSRSLSNRLFKSLRIKKSLSSQLKKTLVPLSEEKPDSEEDNKQKEKEQRKDPGQAEQEELDGGQYVELEKPVMLKSELMLKFIEALMKLLSEEFIEKSCLEFWNKKIKSEDRKSRSKEKEFQEKILDVKIDYNRIQLLEMKYTSYSTRGNYLLTSEPKSFRLLYRKDKRDGEKLHKEQDWRRLQTKKSMAKYEKDEEKTLENRGGGIKCYCYTNRVNIRITNEGKFTKYLLLKYPQLNNQNVFGSKPDSKEDESSGENSGKDSGSGEGERPGEGPVSASGSSGSDEKPDPRTGPGSRFSSRSKEGEGLDTLLREVPETSPEETSKISHKDGENGKSKDKSKKSTGGFLQKWKSQTGSLKNIFSKGNTDQGGLSSLDPFDSESGRMRPGISLSALSRITPMPSTFISKEGNSRLTRSKSTSGIQEHSVTGLEYWLGQSTFELESRDDETDSRSPSGIDFAKHAHKIVTAWDVSGKETLSRLEKMSDINKKWQKKKGKSNSLSMLNLLKMDAQRKTGNGKGKQKPISAESTMNIGINSETVKLFQEPWKPETGEVLDLGAHLLRDELFPGWVKNGGVFIETVVDKNLGEDDTEDSEVESSNSPPPIPKRGERPPPLPPRKSTMKKFIGERKNIYESGSQRQRQLDFSSEVDGKSRAPPLPPKGLTLSRIGGSSTSSPIEKQSSSSIGRPLPPIPQQKPSFRHLTSPNIPLGVSLETVSFFYEGDIDKPQKGSNSRRMSRIQGTSGLPYGFSARPPPIPLRETLFGTNEGLETSRKEDVSKEPDPPYPPEENSHKDKSL